MSFELSISRTDIFFRFSDLPFIAPEYVVRRPLLQVLPAQYLFFR